MVKINLSDINVPELIPDIWSPLNEEQREFLANHFTLQNYKKNEIIHCEGETPTCLMCLLNGKVKIYKDGVGGRSQIIRMIKPTEYFGYRPYFAKADYVTAACAFEPSLVCLIPMTAIMTLLSQNNELAMFFIRRLSIDLGIADERTVNLTQKHIRGRLAESLIFLKESYGLEEDGSTLSIYLSREDLANLSNMTTSNAIRTLSQFAAERLITIDSAVSARDQWSLDFLYLQEPCLLWDVVGIDSATDPLPLPFRRRGRVRLPAWGYGFLRPVCA